MEKEANKTIRKNFAGAFLIIVLCALGIAIVIGRRKLSEAREKEVISSEIQNAKQSGDYKKIIDTMRNADETFFTDKTLSNEYQQALQNEANHALMKADQYLENKDFENARETISDAVDYLGEDDRFEEYLVKIDRLECNSIICEYLDSKDYAEGIQYLQDNYSDILSDKTGNVGKNYSKLLTAFKKKTFEDAEAAYKKEGYKKAEEIINAALDIIEDEDLEKKADYYHKLEPVNLSSLEVFSYGDSGEYNYVFDEHKEDRYHNSYSHSFSINTDDEITFYLDKKYKSFTGTIACPDGYMPKSNLSDVIITIYGDGKMLYKSEPSGPETKPQTYNISVAGIEKLSIQSECQEAMNIWSDWGVYGTIFDGTLVPSL